MAQHTVICIARQFGSGGREVGHALAEALGFKFYDKELLKAAADKSGILQELFEKNDERPISGLAHTLPVMEGGKVPSYADYISYLPNDKMQGVVAEVIREAAETSNCVIIGRCADYILRGHESMLSVFVHAPLEKRIQRIARLHNMDEDGARSLIRKTDRSRANYYAYYTDRDWSSIDNYDVTVDAARLGIDKTVQLLQQATALLANT